MEHRCDFIITAFRRTRVKDFQSVQNKKLVLNRLIFLLLEIS